MMMKRSLGLMCLMLMVAGCQTKPPPAPPAVVEPPPPPPPAKPTSIIMEDSDLAGFQGALREMGTKPIDVPVGWANPTTGKRGAIKVLRDGYDGQNRPCREFHSVVILEDMYQHATGFLCRQPDGAWEVVQARDYPLYRHTP
ncbi:hypothetical protein CHU95_09810 [Niveispirillum lacus]|uniref:Surface antigen domain-containing protein n=1 Tax=Niveispirillum lacus TaxID=1981099 RepID=A0A255Z2I9_9PROT|nr:RT0821/Lpp0805 family surface protein [Niveispirillum lacus]OYQ34870.1 hypothetical protein CHU95_09810 [Niveispirillum lacus]